MATRLWKRIDNEPWMVNPLPPGFGDRMKRYRAQGLSPQEAMRRTWKDVKKPGGTTNPLGEELVVVGALNPRRREVKRMARVRQLRSRRHRRNPANPHRRHRSRTRTITRWRSMGRNPVRHRRYRNPAGAPAIRLMRPMTWLPYLATAGASATATAAAPRLIFGADVNPMTSYLTQGAIGLAGAIVLPMVMSPVHGLVWLATSGGIILADTIGRYALKQLGLGAYPFDRYYPPRLSGTEAYPARWGLSSGAAAYEAVPSAPWVASTRGYGYR